MMVAVLGFALLGACKKDKGGEEESALETEDLGICVEDWCFVYPTPQPDDLNGIWVSDAGVAWAVGDARRGMVWDGARWTGVSLPEGTLRGRAIWGADSGEIWVAGTSLSAHWDGSAWVQLDFEGGDVTGTSASDAWISNQDVVHHYDGSAWTATDFLGGQFVDAAAVDDVWFAGETSYHFDGADWQEFPFPDKILSVDIAALGGGEAWVAGIDTKLESVVYAFSGDSWSPVELPEDVQQKGIASLDVDSDGTVWAVSDGIWTWTGGTWGQESASFGLPVTIKATDAGLWTVGQGGQVHERVDGEWESRGSVGFGFGSSTTTHGCMDSSGQLWAVQSYRSLVAVLSSANEYGIPLWEYWDVSEAIGEQPDILGITCGADKVWVYGEGGLLLEISEHGSAEVHDVGGDVSIFDLWVVDDKDIWAAGVGGVSHYNGSSWQLVPELVGSRMTTVHGSSSSDVWAAGGHKGLWHFDGVSWAEVADSPMYGDLFRLRATEDGCLWAVDGDQLYVGEACDEAYKGVLGAICWTGFGQGSGRTAVDIAGEPHAVLPESCTEGWAVGEYGWTARFDDWAEGDGTQLKVTDLDLHGLQQTSGGSVLAFGEDGVALVYAP